MIDFELSANDKNVLEAVRSEALIARGYARYYDENEHEFPPQKLPEADSHPSFLHKMAERGPDDTSMNTISTLIAMGQTWGDYSVRLRRQERGLGNSALMAAGTDEQKKQWGGLILAMAITEPGCGSDPSRVSTTATRDGDEWVLNGQKIFVTTGCRADGVVVWATIDKSAGRGGIKSFLVLKDTPGFIVAGKEKKLGIRADDTAHYIFEDCRIPKDHLLGLDDSLPKGGSGGFRGVMKTFNMTRPFVAAIGLGMAEAALDFTRDKLREAGIEIEYGHGHLALSGIAERFLGLEAEFEAARLSILRAAWLADHELSNNMESSVCKAKTGRAVQEITQGCIEILGPLGISRDHLLEKWFRDVRITDIYEGTGEIQRLIMARTLLDYTRDDLK